MIYEEWYHEVLQERYGKNPGHQRLGQVYYNRLPEALAAKLVATTMDPFHYDYITQELHDWVMARWEAK